MQSCAGHECCADAQGWNMGLRDASMSFPESAAALDRLIEERVEGELKARADPYSAAGASWAPCMQEDLACMQRWPHDGMLAARLPGRCSCQWALQAL